MLKVEAQNYAKMVGIHGMGGIGKTTLAKAVYNQICTHFDACSFISNVREAAKQSRGLVSCQEQLLRDIFNDNEVKINNIDHGIGMIKRIKSQKVLLVLDDVESKPQLDVLAGNVDWFRSGSRIIITTRNKPVLIGPLKEENVYEVKVLDDIQSLQLFCWHAFGKEEPKFEIAELSKKVADTAVGLPLALEVFGSHFFDLETNKEREDMLKKLKKDQDEGIHERLKISFDALGEKEKTVFLDIACFFIGKDKTFATFMWEDCSLFPDLASKFLLHKSLININEYTGEFEMHDHIRDMGRKIVKDENPSDPGMCSRLWKKDDILYVLQNKRVFGQLKVLKLSFSLSLTTCPDFTTMRHLKVLDFESCQNVSELHPSIVYCKSLTHLNLSDCHSLKELPKEIWQLTSLEMLDLSSCYGIRALPSQLINSKSLKRPLLGKLKVMNLDSCNNLTICPDFRCMPHLEELDFSYCEKLAELHPSIGHLKRLTYLSLRGCELLKELPEGVWQLTWLEEIDLRDCCKVATLPSELGKLGRLKQLFLDGTIITALPESMRHLKQLKHLSLNECRWLKEIPEWIHSCISLEQLEAKKCGSLASLPNTLGNLSSLRNLDLSRTAIEELPSSMPSLTQLTQLCQLLVANGLNSCFCYPILSSEFMQQVAMKWK